MATRRRLYVIACINSVLRLTRSVQKGRATTQVHIGTPRPHARTHAHAIQTQPITNLSNICPIYEEHIARCPVSSFRGKCKNVCIFVIKFKNFKIPIYKIKTSRRSRRCRASFGGSGLRAIELENCLTTSI